MWANIVHVIENNDPVENKLIVYSPPKIQFQMSLHSNCPSVEHALLSIPREAQPLQQPLSVLSLCYC